jgi:hypothetical protein
VATLDDEIDQLYQGPLGAFTAARNALAARAGGRAAAIRALQKPNAAAWAINQLYWHRRKVFDALVAAADRLRAAHARGLAGQAADVASADAQHRAALDAAVLAATAFLRQSGDAAAYATISALAQTLEAVPSPQIRGRLVRPLDPVGFSALASLLPAANAPARRPADVVSIHRGAPPGVRSPRDPAGDARAEAHRARQLVAARRRERSQVERALRAASTRERDAAAALARARTAVARAEARIEHLETSLREARSAAGDARATVETARGVANDSAADRVRLERRLRELDEELGR